MLGSVDESSCWARALASNDPQYLALLVEFGAYESIALLPGYGGAEFLKAGPEAVRYLLDHRLTAGFDRAFRMLARRNRNRALLTVFPDSYFTGLSPEEQVRVVRTMMEWAPHRIDAILVQNDYVALLRFLFRKNFELSKHMDDKWSIIPMVLGTSITGPAPESGFGDDDLVEGVRPELCFLCRALSLE